ncbi:MAG: DUF4364 family protein [Lachnospiraceae bacterium]|nr:DUF4364 family protein [Lachnospiraceae bacterium]MBP5253802.1 DUF4364 family protein [Lachnospiraceae bacterium]
MSEPETLYKLMVLYMLKKVNFPLSIPQIWSFFEEKGYTNYFTFQTTVAQLEEANLLSEETVRNSVLLELTKEGEVALYYFINDISPAVRKDMDEYLTENKYQLRNETGVTADYEKTEQYDYCVHGKVREGKDILFEMKVTVPTEDQARIMCDRFAENAQSIYAYVMKRLM